MQKRVILSMIAAFGLCFTTAASAQTYNKSIDFSTRCVTISGTTQSPNETVNINVLRPGVDVNTLPENYSGRDKIEYAGRAASNEDGEFSIVMTFASDAPTGVYKAYVSPASATAPIVPVEISYTSYTSYKAIIDALNNDGDGNNFATDFTTANNNKYIAMYDALESGVTQSDVITLLDTDDLTYDSVANTQRYYKALLTVYANDGVLTTEIIDYLMDNIGEATLAAQYRNYVTSDDAKLAFITKMSNKNYASISAMTNEISDSLILAVTNYPESLESLKALYTEYATLKSLNVAGAVPASYSAVMGKTWADVSALRTEFNKTRTTTINSGNPSGGSVTGGFSSIGTGGDTSTTPAEIGMKFKDLNSVGWAYNAISELYTRGIVAGRTEEAFYPMDTVKREEFATMMVSALGLDTSDRTTKFKDIAEDAWYAPYISAAYRKGIISGISADKFGAGMEITKQDMAVIIYNSLANKIDGGEPAFTDSANIAGYAKAAVSALSKLGIISGTGDGSFAPTKTATRAEAAVMIFNALNYLQK